MGSVPTSESDGNDAIKRRLNALERTVAFLKSSKATTGKAGTTGQARWYDPITGKLIAAIGLQSDGVTVATRFFRTDGTILGEFVGTGPFGAYLALRDRFNNIIVADDQFQGGLARPRLIMGQWVPNAAMGSNPTAPTSTTYVTVETAEVVINAPFVRVSVRASSSAAGATGNFQVLNSAGAVVVAPTAITPNTTADYVRVPAAIPGFGVLGVVDTWRLQVNLTGTGTIGARGLSIIGSASYDTA
jgi:hypothetical protein